VSTLVVAYSASDAVIEVNVQTTPPDRSSIYNKRIEWRPARFTGQRAGYLIAPGPWSRWLTAVAAARPADRHAPGRRLGTAAVGARLAPGWSGESGREKLVGPSRRGWLAGPLVWGRLL